MESQLCRGGEFWDSVASHAELFGTPAAVQLQLCRLEQLIAQTASCPI